MTKQIKFDVLLKILEEAFEKLPDHRTGQNGRYQIKDAALSAFGAFFMQCPSFLAYQRDMVRRRKQSNAQSLFGVRDIPSDQR